MKLVFLITALGIGLLPGRFACAQTAKVDSLDRLIRQARTDTGRINRMNEKLKLLDDINLDSAVRMGRRTIREAQRIRYKQGEALARLRLARNLNFKGNYPEARQNLLLSEAISLSISDSLQLGKAYNIFGAMYGMQSKYDSSLLYFQKSQRIAENIGNHKDLHAIYSNIGISYEMLSNYPLSLQYLQKALTLAESDKDYTSQAYCLLNLANVYNHVDDRRGAEMRFTQALRLAKRENLKTVELYVYTNLAAIYNEKRTARLSYTYSMKAASLAKAIGDPGIEATSLSRAATSLADQKRFSEAEDVGRRAVVIADGSQQPLNIHQAYSAMGMVLQDQQQYADAIPYYEKSFQVLKDADIYDDQTGQAYANLGLCYEKTGKYRQSLGAYKTATQIRDSVRSKENIRKTTELRLTTAFDKRQQATRAEQQKQNALAEARQLTLLTAVGLLILLTSVAFYAYRTKQKANAQLQDKTDTLQHTLDQLKTTQALLIHQEKMASLGELTAGIAHEIQNPLNFVNNFSDISTELIDELEEEQQQPVRDAALEEELLNNIKQNLTKINLHGKRADAIVKGMLAHSRADTGNKRPTKLNDVAEEYLKLAYQGLRAKDRGFNSELVTDLDPNVGELELVTQDIGRVLLNLYTNAFYAVRQKQLAEQPVLAGEATDESTSYKPTVSVRTQRVGEQVTVDVSDNGTGIPESIQSKIFQPFFTTKPTGEGTGLGLSLSYEIITKGHNGTLSVASTGGEGTTFTLTLPR